MNILRHRALFTVHSPPGSPHPARITSSQSPPSRSPSITPSAFHSRLETSSLSQIRSSIVTPILSGLPSITDLNL